jgi:LmbE family N-acetylglucosaminyl deacetylase
LKNNQPKNCVVIVAHPDDETLWAGGMILTHPHWHWFIIGLCRKHDPDRSPKFQKALRALKAGGILADLDDSPDLPALDEKVIEQQIVDLLPKESIDLILTHSPDGEYTRHLRHEEIGKAVINLWHADKIKTQELWAFAYEDGNREYFPRPIEKATIYTSLSKSVWLQKFNIITEIYGFEKESWEACSTPLSEAFWQFGTAKDAFRWLTNKTK